MKNKTEERVGKKFINKYGSEIEVVEYKRYEEVKVKFTETNYIKWTNWNTLQKGSTISPYCKTVYKYGYIGDGKYNHKDYPIIYDAWHDMIRRCYYTGYHKKNPTYIDCEVCDEWLNFQDFAKWYENNYYQIENQQMNLDKDILVKNNKIYSPETCIFVPHDINSLFTKTNTKRGKYPIGVHFKKNKYHVQIQKYKQVIYLGTYDTPEEAFMVYKTAKENHIKEMADKYKDLIPKKLYDAMYEYEVEWED